MLGQQTGQRRTGRQARCLQGASEELPGEGRGGGCWLGCLLGHIMAADTSSGVRSLRAARPGDSWYSFDLLLGLPFVGYGRTGGLGGEGGVQGAGPVVL